MDSIRFDSIRRRIPSYFVLFFHPSFPWNQYSSIRLMNFTAIPSKCAVGLVNEVRGESNHLEFPVTER